MISRAIDQARTSAITAAISTDQFGPPRVPRMRAVAAGGQLGLEHPARVDRRVGVAVVVGRQQRRRVDAEHPGQRAQVAAGVEVAAAGREVVDLDRLDDVRPDPGALGQLVDGEAEPGAGGDQLRPDDRVVGRLDLVVVDPRSGSTAWPGLAIGLTRSPQTWVSSTRLTLPGPAQLATLAASVVLDGRVAPHLGALGSHRSRRGRASRWRSTGSGRRWVLDSSSVVTPRRRRPATGRRARGRQPIAAAARARLGSAESRRSASVRGSAWSGSGCGGRRARGRRARQSTGSGCGSAAASGFGLWPDRGVDGGLGDADDGGAGEVGGRRSGRRRHRDPGRERQRHGERGAVQLLAEPRTGGGRGGRAPRSGGPGGGPPGPAGRRGTGRAAAVLDPGERTPRQPAPRAAEPDPHALGVGDEQRGPGVDERGEVRRRRAPP